MLINLAASKSLSFEQLFFDRSLLFLRFNLSPSMFAAQWLLWKPIFPILFPAICLIQKVMVTMGDEQLVNYYEYLK